MKSKKLFYCTLLLFAGVLIGLASCSSDHDNDDPDSGTPVDISALIGRSFHKIVTSVGEDMVETKHISIYFKSEYFATVSIWGYDLDMDGKQRWNHGDIDCTYTVNGNIIHIPVYNRDKVLLEDLYLIVKDNSLVGYSEQ